MTTCTGNCNQGRKCKCLTIMPTEINQQLADYADQYDAPPVTPFALLTEIATNVVITLLLTLAGVISLALILGGAP